MSAEMTSSTSVLTIYIPLLNEGTSVVRPTQAVKLGENLTESFRPRTMIPTMKSGNFLPAASWNASSRPGAGERFSWQGREQRHMNRGEQKKRGAGNRDAASY